MGPKRYHRIKIRLVFTVMFFVLGFLLIRVIYITIGKSEYYQQKADDLHEREREIKAKRGTIYDRNGIVLASSQSVCTVSVIHNQLKDPDSVVRVLSEILDLDKEQVQKRVDKVSAIEKIAANVPKEQGDLIRSYKLEGVMVDEDYSRYYPYDDLASKILGFTGGDNQGIVGLEVRYDDILKGEPGKILTVTDVRGIEVENSAENRVAPVDGNDLYLSLDYHIQSFVQQAAMKTYIQKEAKGVSIILMNPQNGEILAMTNVPEFNLNTPFYNTEGIEETNMDVLNQMWRNGCLNDTYEPGSTFKIITSTAALEKGVVQLDDRFFCPGYKLVGDRRIRCHKAGGHGSESFVEGLMNSCNPVFMEVGARVGAAGMYETFESVGLMEKTGIDLPGEAGSIMHQLENIGEVELATISFGQSFQITPIQMLRAVSAAINGGTLITPHLGVAYSDKSGESKETLEYPRVEGAVSAQTSATMRTLLEKVVADGTGSKAIVEGYRIGGKTATSQKLPRGSGKYISSFIGFAPADDPVVLGIILIDEPVGTYYGGTIAAPVMQEIFENILPYLGIEQTTIYNESE